MLLLQYASQGALSLVSYGWPANFRDSRVVEP